MSTTKLITLKAHRFAGRVLQPGSAFEAQSRMARLLTALGRAAVLPATPAAPAVAAPLPPAAAPAPEAPAADLQLGFDGLDTSTVEDGAPKPRRAYRRRDLVAE